MYALNEFSHYPKHACKWSTNDGIRGSFNMQYGKEYLKDTCGMVCNALNDCKAITANTKSKECILHMSTLNTVKVNINNVENNDNDCYIKQANLGVQPSEVDADKVVVEQVNTAPHQAHTSSTKPEQHHGYQVLNDPNNKLSTCADSDYEDCNWKPMDLDGALKQTCTNDSDCQGRLTCLRNPHEPTEYMKGQCVDQTYADYDNFFTTCAKLCHDLSLIHI